MYIHPYMHIHTLYVQNKILYKFYAYDAPYICFTSFHTLRHAYDTFSYTDVTFSQATFFCCFLHIRYMMCVTDVIWDGALC